MTKTPTSMYDVGVFVNKSKISKSVILPTKSEYVKTNLSINWLNFQH